MSHAPIYHAPTLPGDIFACWGTAPSSSWISVVTSSLLAPRGLRFGPCHVAIAADWSGQTLWFESTTLCSHPCHITWRHVNGVQAHLPEDRINDYLQQGGWVVQYRPARLWQFQHDEQNELSRWLINLLGTPYDLPGAIFSGSRIFQLSRLFPEANLNHLFCSELVAALLMRFGRMPVDNVTRYNPARLLRQLVRHGIYEEACRWSAS